MTPAVERPTVDRRAFIARFIRDNGLNYSEATRLYETMCRIFEDAIVAGSKVRIGRMGAIVPVWRPGRDIHMHFKVVKGAKGGGRRIQTGVHRTFYMDGRYDFKFVLYRRFIQTRQLKWFLDFP
jgi:hypothetical protein